MHELSIASAICATAERHAEGRRVTVVSVRVGRMRQVVPDSLRFSFDICARDTVCEGARLELAEITVRLRCTDCGWEWEPEIPAFRCPVCESAGVTIETGEELEVDFIDVEETACTAPG
jgi:hydrogenase nickel incorporation protein HypA/HybF